MIVLLTLTAGFHLKVKLVHAQMLPVLTFCVA